MIDNLVSVMYTDGTGEYVPSRQPDSVTWTTPVIDETFGGTPVLSGESVVLWQFGSTRQKAMTEDDFAAIMLRRGVDGRIRIKTENDATPAQVVEAIGYVDAQPSRTVADGLVLGLILEFRRVVGV